MKLIRFTQKIRPFSDFLLKEDLDPRDKRGRKYEFTLLIDLILIGLMSGEKTIEDISKNIDDSFEELQVLLGIDSVPSHDCLNDLINAINPDKLEEAFEKWVQSYYHPKGLHQIAGDGSFVNASTCKLRNGKEPNIVNFISVETGLVIACQLTMGKGGNETEAFKRILERINLENAVITADALNCTAWIMEYIVENKGFFLFPVKNDKPKLKRKIIESLAKDDNKDLKTKKESFHQQLRLEHGKLVDRRITVSRDIASLKMPSYPYLKQFGLIESTRHSFIYSESGERKIVDTSFKYYCIISNFTCNAQKALMIKIGEWAVETFHKYKDECLLEDHTTLRSERGIFNMAILRRVAYNYLIVSNELIEDFDKKTFKDKTRFFNLNKLLLVNLICGYNPDSEDLWRNYLKKKAQLCEEPGDISTNTDELEYFVLDCFLDLLDF